MFTITRPSKSRSHVVSPRRGNERMKPSSAWMLTLLATSVVR